MLFISRQLAVQTVFSALDYVSKWTQKQRQVQSLGKKGRGAFVPSTELQQVGVDSRKLSKFVPFEGIDRFFFTFLLMTCLLGPSLTHTLSCNSENNSFTQGNF